MYINSCCSGIFPYSTNDYKYHDDYDSIVLFRIGQSNQNGFRSNAGLPIAYTTPDSNIKFWNGSSYVNMTTTANQYPSQSTAYAAEFSCAWKLRASTGKKIYVIKHAVGSTDMSSDWNISGTLYNNAKTTLTNAIAAITDSYKLVIMMNQGENDSNSLTRANAYFDNYTAQLYDLISTFRPHCYICTLTDIALSSGYTYTHIVRPAQKNVVLNMGNPHISYIETSGLKRIDYGNNTAATSTSLTDSSKSWAVNSLVGYTCYYMSGTEKIAGVAITSNTSDTLTTNTWGTTPPTGASYIITNNDLHYTDAQIEQLGQLEHDKIIELLNF